LARGTRPKAPSLIEPPVGRLLVYEGWRLLVYAGWRSVAWVKEAVVVRGPTPAAQGASVCVGACV
jgi:hypothetical protein